MIVWKKKTFADLTKEELYDLLKLRQEVFIVEQNCPYLDNDGIDLLCEHVMGMKEEKIVLYARLIPIGIDYENSWSIGRVITRNGYRQLGLGKELMLKCIEYIGDETITIHAQSYLESFYQSFEFQTIGEEYDLDGIPHKEMRRIVSKEN